MTHFMQIQHLYTKQKLASKFNVVTEGQTLIFPIYDKPKMKRSKCSPNGNSSCLHSSAMRVRTHHINKFTINKCANVVDK